MPYRPERHHRRSIRLRGYNYRAPGAYFVTICVHQRRRILCRMKQRQIELFFAGEVAAYFWQRIPHSFPHATLDAFVIMPDHIHGIIVLHGTERRRKPLQTGRPRGTEPGSLAAIVQNFKSLSAQRINRARGTPGQRVWQEDYYEHIVRSQVDLERIRRYINANPAQWRE